MNEVVQFKMRVELDAHELQALLAEYQEAQGHAAGEDEENPQESEQEKDETKNLTIVPEEDYEETTILESKDVTKMTSPRSPIAEQDDD